MEGVITSSFGNRVNPVLFTDEFHDGIDIAAETGTKVLAVRSGTAVDVYYSNTYGNVLVFDTDNGYSVKFAHLEKVLAQIGDTIEQGQVVALSGNSGLATGSHLHYTLLKNGEAIDPMAYVELDYTEEVAAEYAARSGSAPKKK